MASNWPTLSIYSDGFDQKLVRMHVCTFTNVNFVLIFNKATKNLKKCSNIEQFRAYL